MMAKLFVASIVLALLTFATAEYDVQKYCQLVQPGTKLPSLESCQTYYTCFGNGMNVKSYCSDNDVFDKDAQRCVSILNSNCYYGLSNPCFNKHEQYTYCSNGCNWYNYCINGEISGNGTCSVGQKFYAANGTCIYGKCDSSSQNGIQDMCEIMPENLYFGDFENCRSWHKCFNMNQESGFCDDALVFDVVSGYCLQNRDKMCERTNNVVVGKASGPPEEPCTDVSQVVADENVCSLYYICEISNQTPVTTYSWVQKSCKKQYFDTISKSCSGTSTARTYPGCDRCELKTGYPRTYWTNAVDPNCEQYFTCKNGQKVNVGLRSCDEGYFFNEGAQACIGSENRLEQYIQNNGACQDYTCNDSRVCTMAGASNETIAQPPINPQTNNPESKPADNNTANKTPPIVDTTGNKPEDKAEESPASN